MREKKTVIDSRDSGETQVKYRISTQVNSNRMLHGAEIQFHVDIRGCRPLHSAHFICDEILLDGDLDGYVSSVVRTMVMQIAMDISKQIGLTQSIIDDLKTIIKIRNLPA